MSVEAGFPGVYLITVEAMGSIINPSTISFDAAMRFQPNGNYKPTRKLGPIWTRILAKLRIRTSFYNQDSFFDYNQFVDNAISKRKSEYKIYESVTPMWDNSARRKKSASVFCDSTPEKYGYWLDNVIKNFKPFSEEENILFINAWNEWAEGNHLEPCQKWGRRYLEETKKVLDKYNH